MKVTFRLKRPKHDSPTNLFLDINHNRKRVKFYSDLSIHPELWDHDKQRAAPSRHFKKIHRKDNPGLDTFLENINTDIEDILRAVNNYERECSVKGHSVTAKGLKTYLDANVKETDSAGNIVTPFLVEYFENEYIPKLKSGEITYTKNNRRHKFTQSTIKVKEQSLNAFKEYETKNPKIRFDEIDLSFYDQFVKWHEDKGSSANYIGKLIKELKVILRHTYEAGIHDNKVFESRKFVTLREETKAVYLTKEELDILASQDLEGRDAHYRDMFLVGCYTAMRFSDYSRLEPDHIKKNEQGYHIDLITKKTGERVFVPVHPKIQPILNNPDYFNKNKVYEQKMNFRIKEICKGAKINSLIEIEKMKRGRRITVKKPKYKLITTHTARRTGASLMYLANIPSLDIMKITGHKTEKAFLKYIRVTKEETAQRLAMHPFFIKQAN